MPDPIPTQPSFLKYSSGRIYLLLTTFFLLLTFGINECFMSEEIYFQSFGEKLATDRIIKMIDFSLKWQWTGYVVIPLVILIRVNFTAVCIFIGNILCNSNIRYRDLFKAVLLSDFVFVFAGIIKLVLLIFFKQVETLEDLQFQPFSLLELVDQSKIEPFLLYPLSLFSVFELLYWFVLAWLLSRLINRSFAFSLKRVAVSYGAGLFLWVLLVMFITINLNT